MANEAGTIVLLELRGDTKAQVCRHLAAELTKRLGGRVSRIEHSGGDVYTTTEDSPLCKLPLLQVVNDDPGEPTEEVPTLVMWIRINRGVTEEHFDGGLTAAISAVTKIVTSEVTSFSQEWDHDLRKLVEDGTFKVRLGGIKVLI